MKVPFTDFPRQYAPIRDELHKAAAGVIDSGRYIGGDEVKNFEREMAAWMGVAEVCGTSCATSGLFAIMKCMGIGAGDEVITTVNTAIPTAEAVSLTGAQVVFCDLKPDYFFLDPAQIESKITPRTKAIVPVHLYGQPADMDAIFAIAARHNLRVIEDCAQAQGARYRGKIVGAMAEAAAFSFFPSKNLGGFGDGGAVTAKDPMLLKRIRMFCNHGRESKYDHEFEGTNSRLDTLQAALLRIVLRHLDEYNELRRRAAARYDRQLADVAKVVTPKVLPETTPVYHVYVVVVPDREALAAHLKEQGIETGVHYPRSLNLLKAYAHLGQGRGTFPVAEYACDHMLSLPMHPAITKEEVDCVCKVIRAFYGH